ncbi:hypothetical protein PPL_09558 [Heterostelium album PN500]|uniref:Chitin-binding type-4 domain-containing protein n=1 Tax=Heterostelium pallidum (strain ATCC 26659 / Pp 5 / PN500) TaxID=670386 RepID=D3BNE6_HETP5|nr:hypothetical protein PPL_09558 [Heterostelium album PN500]EFA76806.1 hypothetical protein PPL_09558 [Heterostelium album PN500]|eukprot:XP_020428938.1 hypothetical protein PPL_09558 [Heterostelium album PN500]
MRSSIIAISLLLIVTIAKINGHLCILDPPQRGAKLPSPLYAGDNNCYKIASNCGGVAAGSPVASYRAGSYQTITFQQNYNHWFPSNIGYMDVAISYAGDNGQYQTLYSMQDFNAWDMVSQTNLSVPVTFPKTKCTSCVLRVRYISNNSGEPNPDFYQCSDITLH